MNVGKKSLSTLLNAELRGNSSDEKNISPAFLVEDFNASSERQIQTAHASVDSLMPKKQDSQGTLYRVSSNLFNLIIAGLRHLAAKEFRK